MAKSTTNFFKIPELKYKKYHKSRIKLQEYKKELITTEPNAICSIKALESAKINAKQLIVITRNFIKMFTGGSIHLKQTMTPNYPVTERSIGSRQGKGKGEVKDLLNFVASGKYIIRFYMQMTISAHTSLLLIYRIIKKRFSFLTKLVLNPIITQEYHLLLKSRRKYA